VVRDAFFEGFSRLFAELFQALFVLEFLFVLFPALEDFLPGFPQFVLLKITPALGALGQN